MRADRLDRYDQPPWVAARLERRARIGLAATVFVGFVGLIVSAAIPQLTPIFVLAVLAGLLWWWD